MEYNLKDKIKITDEFLNELISKNWQESEAIQQQIANIDTSTKLGTEVVKLLENICTSYYVFIGCLEALAENTQAEGPEIAKEEPDTGIDDEVSEPSNDMEEITDTFLDDPGKHEPFEYFVDFDEPVGESLTDTDLYG